MLTDTEVDVASLAVLVGEIATSLDVVEGGAKEVSAAADEQGHGLSDGLEDNAASLAGSDRLLGLEGRDRGEEIGNLLFDTRVEKGG